MVTAWSGCLRVRCDVRPPVSLPPTPCLPPRLSCRRVMSSVAGREHGPHVRHHPALRRRDDPLRPHAGKGALDVIATCIL